MFFFFFLLLSVAKTVGLKWSPLIAKDSSGNQRAKGVEQSDGWQGNGASRATALCHQLYDLLIRQ